jgi:hypothetical protein
VVYGDPVPHPGEDELTVGVQDTKPVGKGDLAAQLHRLTEIVIDGQARTDARLDRIGTEMAKTRAQLGRLESSTQRRFDRVDAEFESWGVYIKNAELKMSLLPPPRAERGPSAKKRNPGGASGRDSRRS